jgi:DNA repair photolyase
MFYSVPMPGERLFELGRRTFDTPQFRGIEFIEVESKSILNHVPGNSLPFSWTINPYRGCTHACSYCTAGDTPILMADGRTKPIKDVRVGDRIYGTEPGDRYRRYVTTEVLDHWETVKPAYRISLADGTELMASGDHRFLSDRGWKHVFGSDHATVHLGDRLIGLEQKQAEIRSIEGMSIDELRADGREVLAVDAMERVMPMYDITTGTGDFIANGVVSHNCFARATHTYMDMNAGRDFETKIVVKVNAPDLLRRELRAKRWKGEAIAMGTATDPYQRAEGKYRLMPRIIETLTAYRNPFSILTKGTLILRDIDLLTDAARVTEVTTAFSIGTVDEQVWRTSEPGTPHPRKRLEAVARLNEAGIPCGVLIAPVLPGLSDSEAQIQEVVTAAIEAGATHVSPILLHLRPKVKDVYMEWLVDTYPHLVPMYEEMYGRRAYAETEPKKRLGRVASRAIEAAGGLRNRPPSTRMKKRSAKRRIADDRSFPGQQMSLL